MNKELKPYHVHLICNAKYHDSDFARLELLKLLAEHDDISVTVSDNYTCLLYTSPSPRDRTRSRMPSSA